MKPFAPSRHFQRQYDRLFRDSPQKANLFLLICELADKKGRVKFDTPFPEIEIQRLMAARFNDPRAYQLPGGPKR